jgi:transcriptional regulator with XRE-family HTH domain
MMVAGRRPTCRPGAPPQPKVDFELAKIRRPTKAELARRIGAAPAVMRRLLSAEGQNPTLTTLLKIAAALRMEMELRDAGAAAYHEAG